MNTIKVPLIGTIEGEDGEEPRVVFTPPKLTQMEKIEKNIEFTVKKLSVYQPENIRDYLLGELVALCWFRGGCEDWLSAKIEAEGLF
jgi:hypothetical protein